MNIFDIATKKLSEKVLTISNKNIRIKYINTIVIDKKQYAIFVDYSSTDKTIYAIYYDNERWTYVKGL